MGAKPDKIDYKKLCALVFILLYISLFFITTTLSGCEGCDSCDDCDSCDSCNDDDEEDNITDESEVES